MPETLGAGLHEDPPSSAFEIYSMTRHRTTRSVVLATGHNNDSIDVFSSALRKLCALAGHLGQRLIWITFAERSDIRIRAMKFNHLLRQFSATHDGFALAHWNALASGSDRYFVHDGVHLSRSGAILAARIVTEALSLPTRGNYSPS